jgi:FkbM family methyltransferase
MCGADQNRRTSFTVLPSVVLKFIIRPFIGTGIGRFRLINDCYRWVARSFIIPQEKNIITINGYKMYVNLDRKEGLDGIGQELLFNGTYERFSTALFQQFIKPGMTVVAIGANSGYFVLLFSTLAGQRGQVYAFEPAPQNFKILTSNIELNGFKNITALQKAVADKSGNSLLYIDSSDPAGHSLFNEAVSPVADNAGESCAVEVVSLDDYFSGSDTKIDAIQMDIQGAEILATRGMANLLLKNNDIK